MSWRARLDRLLAPLAPLDRKLARDLWHIRGQGLAIAVVIGCGVAVFVMSVGMIRSLDLTRDTYYERYRFADLYAAVTRAPLHLLSRLADLPGMRAVEGRISANAIVDVPGMDEPVTGRLHALPMQGAAKVNALVLRQGRWLDPTRAHEVLVNQSFAEAHGLQPGDGLAVTMKGKKQRLAIAGLVLSPEYVYAIAPGQIIPDNRRFAVLWMGYDHLAAAYDLEGAFNEMVATLDHGTSAAPVIDAVDRLLARYGGTGAYVRSEQISEKFVANEMDQLRTMTAILPPIFLGVAAFLLNVVLARLIATEREQIGLLKAFGYANTAIVWHYAKMVLILTSIGILLGFAVGAWLGRGLARLYTDFFVFPFLLFRAGADVYALAALISLAAALSATFGAVLRAARLSPATAMQPPAPADYSGRLLNWLARPRWLNEPSRMILRHVLRKPMRAGVTVLGLGLALGLRIATDATLDDTDRMMELIFDYGERQDATLLLAEPRSIAVMHDLHRLPGVRAAEPFRAVPAILHFGARERRQGLTGVTEAPSLNRMIDTATRPVAPPSHGLLLSRSLSRELGVRTGDVVTVQVTEGARPVAQLRVSGLVDSFIGTPAYMALDALNRLMQDGEVISGAYLLNDRAQRPALYRAIKETPQVAAISFKEASIAMFQRTVEENIGIMTLFNTIFASLIVVGVVYNNARISLSEKARDLASLRVLGFTRAEVSAILLGELALLTLLSLPLGIGFGVALSWYMAEAFSNDLFTLPFALTSRTVAIAVITVLLAAVASALIVRRRVDRLDLIGVLKTRE
ncbi:MAG: ABC transporter permease [Pseudomonadota bacterium]